MKYIYYIGEFSTKIVDFDNAFDLTCMFVRGICTMYDILVPGTNTHTLRCKNVAKLEHVQDTAFAQHPITVGVAISYQTAS